MQEELDKHHAEWANDRVYRPNKGTRQQRWRTSESESSGNSSTAMQSLQSSANWSNSGGMQHIHMGVLPRVGNSPPLPQTIALNLHPQLEISRETSYTRPNYFSGMADDPLGNFGEKQPPAEVPRSSSPRVQMNMHRAEHSTHQLEPRMGEMDKFLAHRDDDFRDDPVRAAEEWRKLPLLISKALKLRSRLRNKRLDLQEKQSIKSAADEAFMRHVRESRVSPTAATASNSILANALDVDSLYSAMQNARDDCGECEYEYSELEELLDETEFQLAKTERHLRGTKLSELPESEIAESTMKRSDSITSSAPDSLLGISSGHAEDYDPLQAEFLSRLGDLDLAKERYDNLGLERDRLLSRQATWLPVGLDLHDDEKLFLSGFQNDEVTIQKEIAKIEADLDRLKEQCLMAGLDISTDNTWSEQGSGEEDDPRRSNEGEEVLETGGGDIIQETTARSSYSTFPLILPSPLALLAISKIKIPFDNLITEFDENNKGDRICRWLLHKLRASPMEVELLVRVFLQIVRLLSFQQWKTDILQYQWNVLSLWEKDRANKDQSAFKAIPTPSFIETDISSILLKGESQETKMTHAKPPQRESYVRRVRSVPGAFKPTKEVHGKFRILSTAAF